MSKWISDPRLVHNQAINSIDRELHAHSTDHEHTHSVTTVDCYAQASNEPFNAVRFAPIDPLARGQQLHLVRAK